MQNMPAKAKPLTLALHTAAGRDVKSAAIKINKIQTDPDAAPCSGVST